MFALRWLLLAPLLVGCKGGGDGSSAGAPPVPADAGTVAASSVTIHVRTPVTETSSSAGNNATWAAWLDDTGAWTKLEPQDARGTYGLSPTGERWTVAFACADEDKSLVAVYERPRTVTSLEVELESQCGPEDTELYDLTGTFGHVPLTTSWLDFGYALDGRGFTMPATGDSAPYQILNVVAGTWDIGFGLRNEGGGPLTKLMLVRNQAITGPTTLDLDVAAIGLEPLKKKLVVNGIAAEENFSVTASYALGGGYFGVDIGPQDVPFGKTTAEMEYVTFPPAAVLPTDRHRINAHAADADNERAVSWRDVDLVFQAAIDATADLPAGLEEPRADVVTSAPYVRLATFVKTRPNAATYQAHLLGRVSNRVQHSWRISVDAGRATGPEVELTMPDLSAAAGWKAKWAIPVGVSPEIDGTVAETVVPYGDGTITRSATHKLFKTLP